MSTSPDAEAAVIDNPDASRFELRLGDDLAIAQYTIRGDAMIFTHTEVPPHLEGHGVGSRLAQFALDQARARKLKVVPRCPFIADFIEQHPEYRDLVRTSV